MNKIWTYDKANILIENADALTLAELESLIEFIIGKGIEVKINNNNISVEWSKATKEIMLLVKHLIIKTVKK